MPKRMCGKQVRHKLITDLLVNRRHKISCVLQPTQPFKKAGGLQRTQR